MPRNQLMCFTTIGLLVIACTGCNLEPSPPPPSITPAVERQQAPERAIFWQVDTSKNPVTGEISKTAYLKYQGKQNIFVRRRGKKFDLYINTDQFLETVGNMHTRRSTVMYRFDDEKPTKQSWTISDDNEALFYPSDPKPFVKKLTAAHTLAFQYEPADKLPVPITFSVEGFPSDF